MLSDSFDNAISPSVPGLASYDSFGGKAESLAVSNKMIDRSFKRKGVSQSIPAPLPVNEPTNLVNNFIIDRKIIKNADLSIIVEDIKKSKEIIEQKIIKKLGGYVENSNFSRYPTYQIQRDATLANQFKQANYTIRVPSDKFDEAIRGLKGIAYKVQNESINSRDVTLEYVDVETQIKNKKIALQRLEEILKDKKLNKEMKDVFATLREIDKVTGEIDRYESRFKRLKSQVTMSTIRLSLIAKKQVKIGDNKKIWTPSADAKDAYNRLIDKLIIIWRQLTYFVIESLPVILINLFFIYLVYKIFMLIFSKKISEIFKKTKDFVEKISKTKDK